MPSRRQKHSRSYEHTEELILKALKKNILSSKRFYTTSLVRDAGITERSFYNHYNDLDDLLLRLEKIVKNSIKIANKDVPETANLQMFFERVLVELYKNRSAVDIFVAMKKLNILETTQNIIEPRIISYWQEAKMIKAGDEKEAIRVFMLHAAYEIYDWSREHYSKDKINSHIKSLYWLAKDTPRFVHQRNLIADH